MAALLTDAELRHFSAKGWVLRKRVLTPGECRRLMDATDRELARDKGKLRPNASEDGTAADVRRAHNQGHQLLVVYGPLF